MKNRTLTLLAACLLGGTAFAQWSGEAPSIPDATPSEVIDGHQYQIAVSSTEASMAGMFLTGGSSWYTWATSLIVDVRDNAITYLLTASADTTYSDKTVWTLQNVSGGLYTFVSGAISDLGEPYDGLGELHVDMASQGHQYFELEQQSDGTYHISLAASDTTYTNHYSGCLGVMPNAESYGVAVYAFLDPTVEGNECNWIFVDMSVYQARCDLYDALVESNNYSPIDGSVVAAANTVYLDSSASVEDLEAQVDALKNARNAIIGDGASLSDPNDLTVMIDNPTFDGSIDGWTHTFDSQATNKGYQSASYTNTSYTYVNHEGEVVNPFCSGFMEAWAAADVIFNDAVEGVSRNIGNAQLSQTISGVPEGNYRLSCDAISSCQDDASVVVTGVQLFATDAAGNDFYSEISTANGVPEHVTQFFYTSGGTLTIGLRTVDTNANWIAFDNVELLYYGAEEVSVYYIELQEAVTNAEATYTNMDEVFALASLKAAYEDALAEAKAVLVTGASDEALQEAVEAFNAAVDALATSVSEYSGVADYIDYMVSVQAQALENGWDTLADDLADYQEKIEDGYADGTLTSEEIAAMEDDVTNMIADYISDNCKAGDDITILINNPNFDTDFSGWSLGDDSATPAFGGTTSDFPENTIEGGTQLADINSGCAEVYHATFDMYQTIKNMPIGLYTLACNGFERDDNGAGIECELYAQIEGEDDQTAKLVNALDDGSLEMLYDADWDDAAVTLSNGESGYIPDNMAGANIYFYEGHYNSSLQILLTSRTDVTIGVRTTSDYDWIIFDNFSLVYEGNTYDVYLDLLEELIEQAETMPDQGLLTKEADGALNDAINQAYDAEDLQSSEECVAAIQALRDAISFAEETITLTDELEFLYDETNEIRLVEAGDLNTTDENFLNLVEVVGAALDGEEVIETNEAVEQYISDLKTGFVTYVLSAISGDESEDNPLDITCAILMHECAQGNGEGSIYGWVVDGNTDVGLGNGAAELYSSHSGDQISQTLHLVPGYYRLGVQGFYRGTAGMTVLAVADADSIDAIRGADLFAGETATRLASIVQDAETYSTTIAASTSTTEWTVPNTMEEASTAFGNDLYLNSLQFQVTEEGDVAIGITKTGSRTNDWIIWDNWTLEYIGTTEPSEDTTTSIAGTEGDGAAVISNAIYTVDGKQVSSLAPGINIVKTTLADGTVKVQKVLVK